MPAPRKAAVQQLARERGKTASALMNRLIAMYMRDPVAFEKCFQEVCDAQRRVVSNSKEK